MMLLFILLLLPPLIRLRLLRLWMHRRSLLRRAGRRLLQERLLAVLVTANERMQVSGNRRNVWLAFNLQRESQRTRRGKIANRRASQVNQCSCLRATKWRRRHYRKTNSHTYRTHLIDERMQQPHRNQAKRT